MTRTPFFSRFTSKQQRIKRGLGTPAIGHSNAMERNQMSVRWLVLVLTCTLMIGNYYCYDNPSALKEQLYERFEQNMSRASYESNFQLLYSLYSFPNVVLPFFGGLLVDRMGARVALLIFGGLITLGQCVLALGCSIRSFPLMMVGRVIFGFGGESLTVAQSAIVSLWFKGRELAMALGINLSIARLGGTINNQLSPFWAQHSSLTFALWFGVIMCCVSLCATLVLIPIDVRAEKRTAGFRKKREKSEAVALGDVRHFGRMLWLLTVSCVVVYGCVLPFNNTASSFLLERDLFKAPSIPFPTNGTCSLGNRSCCCCTTKDLCWQNSTNQFRPLQDQCAPYAACSSTPPYQPVMPLALTKKVDCGSDAKQYGLSNYSPQKVMLGAAKAYCDAKAKAEKKAALIMSIPYFISACISPFLGFVVDRIGKRAVIATAAPALLVAVHLTLARTGLPGQYPLIGQGLAYSAFAAALWPSVPYVVDDKYVGTAYGVITAVQNLGLATIPLAAAGIYKSSGNNYVPNVEYFFVALASIGTLIGIWLMIEDPKYGSPMNSVHMSTEPCDTTEPNPGRRAPNSGMDNDANTGAGTSAGDKMLTSPLLVDEDRV